MKLENIASRVIANYLGQGWAALMAIAFLPVYIATLGLEAYGLIGFFLVLQAMLAVFDFGMTATLMREAARYRTEGHTKQSLRNLVRTYELIAAILNIALALILWCMANHLATEWVNATEIKNETVVISIVLMGFVIAARLQEGIYRGVLIGLGNQLVLNIAYAFFATARYAGAVMVLRYGSADIVTFFIWQVVVSVLSVIVMAILANRYLPASEQPPRFSPKSLVSVWRFSLVMAVVACLTVVLANLDKLIFSRMMPLDEFGYYALAAGAAGVLYLFIVPITQGFYPQMVAKYVAGDREALAYLHHLSSQFVSVSAGSIAIVVMLFSNQIIYVWSGSAELAAVVAPVLVILVAGAMANCMGYIGYNLQLVRGAPAILVVIGVIAVLITLLVLPTMVDKFGLSGGAASWCGIVLLQAFTILIVAHRGSLKGEGFRWLTRDVTLPLVGAISTAWLLSYITPYFESGGRIILLFFLIFVGLSALLVATLLAPDLRGLVKSFFNVREMQR